MKEKYRFYRSSIDIIYRILHKGNSNFFFVVYFFLFLTIFRHSGLHSKYCHRLTFSGVGYSAAFSLVFFIYFVVCIVYIASGMSSIGTGYDLAAATFSPDGRIFQIEYAQKAVDNGNTMVALCGKHGVVTAIDKVIASKCYVENANPRMANLNEEVGGAFAGVYPDCRALKDYAVREAQKYLKEYREPITVKKLANAVAEYVHIFTLGISRPFGVSAFLSAWDEKKGGSLYLIEPSGLSYEYRAWATGKHRQAAKAEIEKLKLDDLSLEDMVKEAARIVVAIREEGKDKEVHIEMGWVGDKTGGKHESIPRATVQAAEQWAKTKMEEEDMED